MTLTRRAAPRRAPPPPAQTLDRGGVVAAPTDKGIVQQARHVWSLSHAVRSKAMTGQAARRAKALARSSWHFMRDHIHRAAEPGTW